MIRRSGKIAVFVPADQLNPGISSLAGVEPADCVVLMVESLHRARMKPHHKQKLVFLWSAMRHFAEELKSRGYEVDYYETQPDFKTAFKQHLQKYEPQRVRLMERAEFGCTRHVANVINGYGIATEVTPNNQFLSDREWFTAWAGQRKTLRMESFYREMRRRTGLLLDEGGGPEGDQWNYDELNRERPPADHRFPDAPQFEPDSITQEVMKFVEANFADHFGRLDSFNWPVTRKDAQRSFEEFLDHRLDLFGPYEDAIVHDEPVLYHSQVSPLLNVGLLEPLEICQAAEARHRRGEARINSVEGFIRQIIGWREFIYQVYQWKMPGYTEANALGADLPLPDFYWDGKTRMQCVADAINALIEHGINHHIQRLMVTGNFALIAGIDPQQVNDWYHFGYIDAYEWVVSPNVLGMALFADDGLVATKPYAASANYLKRMSDCCGQCHYDPGQTLGAKGCPFNSLYWDFLDRNRKRFAKNARMNLMMRQLDRKKDLDEIRARARHLREALKEGQPL